jgi:hypothetical protein
VLMLAPITTSLSFVLPSMATSRLHQHPALLNLITEGMLGGVESVCSLGVSGRLLCLAVDLFLFGGYRFSLVGFAFFSYRERARARARLFLSI